MPASANQALPLSRLVAEQGELLQLLGPPGQPAIAVARTCHGDVLSPASRVACTSGQGATPKRMPTSTLSVRKLARAREASMEIIAGCASGTCRCAASASGWQTRESTLIVSVLARGRLQCPDRTGNRPKCIAPSRQMTRLPLSATPPPAARKQLHPEEFLERFDLMAHRAVRDVQLSSAAAEKLFNDAAGPSAMGRWSAGEPGHVAMLIFFTLQVNIQRLCVSILVVEWNEPRRAVPNPGTLMQAIEIGTITPRSRCLNRAA